MSANDRQVGGSHYKIGGEEHWDRIWRLYGRGYFVGCITKYVERYHIKGGIPDLEKAAHFLQKLTELEKSGAPAGIHYAETPGVLKRGIEVVQVTLDSPTATPQRVVGRMVDSGEPQGRGYVDQDR